MAVYAGGAVVALWLSATIVGAVNAVPLVSLQFCGFRGLQSLEELTEWLIVASSQVPKLLELVGLGYTSWFVYRYLLFKVSNDIPRTSILHTACLLSLKR